MSERSTAAPSASLYRTLGSPQDGQSSPTTSHSAAQSVAALGDVHKEFGSTRIFHGSGPRSQELPPRIPDVHNILNPSESRRQAPEGGPLYLARTREHGSGGVSPTRTPHALPQPYYYNQPGNISHPGTPVSPTAPAPGPGPSATTSPITGHTESAIQQPPHGRRILSPRAPRPSSMIYGAPSRDQDVYIQNRAPSASPAKRPYEHEHSEEYRPHPGSQPSSVPHTPNMPGASIARSFSQPIVPSAGGSQQPPLPFPPPDAQGRGSVSPAHRLQQSPRGIGARSFSTLAAHGDQRQLPWADPARRPSIGATLMGGEGQAMMMLPGSDTPIAVPVDNTQASKKANEKRGKNAEASTRHRKKKKEEQEKQFKRVEELEGEKDLMRIQMAELSAQLEHHRNEHHRLHEIIRSTPSISHLVEVRPVSPPLSRPPVTIGGRQHDPSREYSSEASSAERPAQRPRLEEHGGTALHHYAGTPTGTPGHTPLQSPVYGGMPPRPESASSSTGGIDRLPPLRSMEGLGTHNPPQGQGPAHEQDPRTGQWAPVQPRTYETGWATGHRRPSEAPPR